MFAAWDAAGSRVRDVTLNVRAGEILGVAGLVGAGRTELARILFGLTPADSGEIRLRGRIVSIGSPAHAVDLGIAYLPEDRRRHGVILEMAIGPNATLATLRAIRGSDSSTSRQSAPSLPASSTNSESRLRRSRRQSEISRAVTSRRWRWRVGWRQNPLCSSSMNRRKASTLGPRPRSTG